MRILALETSGFSGSVAAAQGSNLLGEITLEPRQRTGLALAPALRDLLQRVGWKASDVQLVAVTQGPGSFTGLRVGVTSAKSFAYATGAEVLGVDTLDVLAAQVPVQFPTLSTIINAEREQLFSAMFARAGENEWERTAPTSIVDRETWRASLHPGSAVTGTGLDSNSEFVPLHASKVEEALWRPQAAAVARVAWRDYQAGRRSDVWKLLPNYYRESAAVEKLAF